MTTQTKTKKEREEQCEPADLSEFGPNRIEAELTDEERRVFLELTSLDLTPEQVERVRKPWTVHHRQKEILAVHWHPEWIPLDLIRERLDGAFPHSRQELVIPTQHNQLMTMGGYSGVEVDCYSSGFGRKVQLLLHFKAEKVADAHVLKSMLDHTFKYRSSQLFELMDSILDDRFEHRLETAATETGASEEVVGLVRFYTARLRRLILEYESQVSPMMIKNKLIPEFISAHRGRHRQNLLNRALLLVAAVKRIVKAEFSLDYFFRATEVIEEARGLGGGVVIPHPEQFWPILLADYDVDGWETWNPQSQEYTRFLISALTNQNKLTRPGRRSLLVFMGDDTHLSVKVRDPETLDQSKLEREVGLQPAWDDVGIRKSLSLAGADRAGVIAEYKARLG